ncbi:hypothetical protein NKH77_05635 [Streptomyces sp. M19]
MLRVARAYEDLRPRSARGPRRDGRPGAGVVVRVRETRAARPLTAG